jgi:DNA-binding NtrC family response regulator
VAFNSGKKALEQLTTQAPHLVISDLKMDQVGGLEILRSCRELLPQTPVILITAYAKVESALEAMRNGAYDYLTKPFKIDELQLVVQRALENQSLVRENRNLRQIVREKYRFENIIGNCSRMQEIYRLIAKVANTDSTILIQGESGTGKELVARALHFNSNRAQHPFVAINCSALPENLLESELFGHKKGAFTGAVQDKIGLFEEAEHGTIFLDEVNSMAQPLQTKLLRVLQERQIRRVGDTKSLDIRVRVLAATNEGLLEKSQSGQFREDLYYRLAVIPIEMPPLRERTEDIPLLVNHFLQKNATHAGAEPKRIDPKAIELFQQYRWPGNVRELENAVERACALCDDGLIRTSDLPPLIARQTPAPEPTPLGLSLEEFSRIQEQRYISETLKTCGGNREKASKLLGISVATLYRKLDSSKSEKPEA